MNDSLHHVTHNWGFGINQNPSIGQSALRNELATFQENSLNPIWHKSAYSDDHSASGLIVSKPTSLCALGPSS